MRAQTRRQRLVLAICLVIAAAFLTYEFRDSIASIPVIAANAEGHFENLSIAGASAVMLAALVMMGNRLRMSGTSRYGAPILVAMFGGGGKALYEKAIGDMPAGARSRTRVFGVWPSDATTRAKEPPLSRFSAGDRVVLVPKGQSDARAAKQAHESFAKVYRPIAAKLARGYNRLLVILSTGGHTGSFAARESLPVMSGAESVAYVTGDSSLALLRALEDPHWGAKSLAIQGTPTTVGSFPANANEGVFLTALEARPQQINCAAHKEGELDIPAKDATDTEAILIQAAIMRRTDESSPDPIALRQHEPPVLTLVMKPVHLTQVSLATVLADMNASGIPTSVGSNRRLSIADLRQRFRADCWAVGPADARDLAAGYLSGFCETYNARPGNVMYSPDAEAEQGDPVRAFVALEASDFLLDAIAPGMRAHPSYASWKTQPNAKPPQKTP